MFARKDAKNAKRASGKGYLRTVCEYVHLNLVRAHFLERDQLLRTYPFRLGTGSKSWPTTDTFRGASLILPPEGVAGSERARPRAQQRSQSGRLETFKGACVVWGCCARGRGQGYLGRSVLVLEQSNVEYCSGRKITKILTNAEVAATEDGRTPGLSAYQPPQSRPNPSGIARGRTRSSGSVKMRLTFNRTPNLPCKGRFPMKQYEDLPRNVLE